MNKIIFSIIFSTFLIALTAGDVFACTCFLQEDISIEKQVKDAYQKSSSVFVGEVVEVLKKPDAFFVTVRFNVEKSWNKKFQKEITISTGTGGGDCGYEFAVGKKYLVYAYGDNKLSTNICTRTASFTSNKDIAVLNKIKKPKIKSSPK
jgi:hypothetical protein